MGSLAEFDKAIELDPRQKACRFLNFKYFVTCVYCLLRILILSITMRLFGAIVYRSLAKGAISLLSR